MIEGRTEVNRLQRKVLFLLLAAGSAGGVFVVEDAVSGIAAAKAGGMAALAVARHDDHEFLIAAGADLVVTSIDEVSVDGLSEGRLVRLPRQPSSRLSDSNR